MKVYVASKIHKMRDFELSNCEYIKKMFTQELVGGKEKFELMNLIGFC